MQENKRYYWLGQGQACDQDRFFIEALDKNLWEQGDQDRWDTCWYTGMPEDKVFEQLQAHQSVNHIPGNSAITIKSNLYDTLVAAKNRLAGTAEEQRFDFFPETFSMPEDYFRFQKTAQAEPEQLWIKKPKNLSRGRGIDMVRHPSTVPLDEEWIIQRYLSNPHLCQGRKYVLRCYVLITSVEPLRFYWYQDGFAKLASESYSKDDLDNLYRHLTNPDVNEQNENAESAITFISFQKYRQWLESEGHDSNAFFHALKELIALTVIATREAMRKRLNGLNENANGCYELIGLDCMVDENIKPWIVECNLSPSLSTYADPDAGADDEVVAKRDMVKDLVGLLGLNNPLSASWTKEEKALEEHKNCGNFECLFPTQDANNYFPLFPVPRYQDIAHTQALATLDSSRLQLKPHSNSDYTFSDSVTIFAVKNTQGNTQCISPNDIATWIWLKTSEGASPEAIISELGESIPCPEGLSNTLFTQQIAQQVWDVLADWSHANVFSQQVLQTDTQPQATPMNVYLPVGDSDVSLHIFCENAAHYLQDFYRTNSQQTQHPITIDIIPTPYGYTLIQNRVNVVHGRKLSQLLPTIYRLSIEQLTPSDGQYYLSGSLVSTEKQNVFIISDTSALFDKPVYDLLKNNKIASINKGILLSTDNTLSALHLPITLPLKTEADNALVVETKDQMFKYLNTSCSIEENIQVDTIVFLNTHSDEPADNDNATSQLMSKTDTLKKVWENSHDNSHEKVALVAQWIESIEQCYLIEGSDNDAVYQVLLHTVLNEEN